jgi:glycosyltransferase involved in cell wall biosynthesis
MGGQYSAAAGQSSMVIFFNKEKYQTAFGFLIKPFKSFLHLIIRFFYRRTLRFGNIENYGWINNQLSRAFEWLRIDQAIQWLNAYETQTILDRFPQVNTAWDSGLSGDHRPLLTPEIKQKLLPACTHFISELNPVKADSGDIAHGFSIIIPFYGDLEYLHRCLKSVSASDSRSILETLQVIIVNDDPRVSQHDLEGAIPQFLLPKVLVLQNSENMGICESLNRGVARSHYPWIVHLDCDDLLTFNSLGILAKRIRQFPQARYISSQMIDIDGNGMVLRYRLRRESPCQLLTHGMIAGHLKAIRKDLFQDIGLYRQEYEGCQDYEFALRTSFFEPLLFIPDYLYKYRWHGNTQSVSKAERQVSITRKIIDTYLTATSYLSSEVKPLISVRFEGPYGSDWQKEFPNVYGRESSGDLRVNFQTRYSRRDRTLFSLEAARFLMKTSQSLNEHILTYPSPSS